MLCVVVCLTIRSADASFARSSACALAQLGCEVEAGVALEAEPDEPVEGERVTHCATLAQLRRPLHGPKFHFTLLAAEHLYFAL